MSKTKTSVSKMSNTDNVSDVVKDPVQAAVDAMWESENARTPKHMRTPKVQFVNTATNDVAMSGTIAPKKLLDALKKSKSQTFGVSEVSEAPGLYTGAYAGKPSFVDLIAQFEAPIKAIAHVHYRAARKYGKYSWFNTPLKSNSSLKNNIDALFRHFGAHSMGKFTDIEGLPHAFHMTCRAGMLATIFYRTEKDQSTEHLEDPTRHIPNYSLDTDNLYENYPLYITSEELLSLHKIRNWEILSKLSYNDLLAEIQKRLFNIARYVRETKNPFYTTTEDVFEYVQPCDQLFGLIATFLQRYLEKHGCSHTNLDEWTVPEKSLWKL